MSDLAIDIQDLRKTYRDGWFGGKRVEALRGVSLQIPRGQIFGLLGPNGAGKTTLIKALLGIIRSSGGSAKLMGYRGGDRRGRRQVGYLPEGHRIPSHHNGNTALEFFGRLSGMSYRDIRSRREELLDTVGLAGWGKTPIRKYSKGMQQRLGLAQAMLHDPELLILDEPTDGVDPVGRSDMRDLLFQLRDAGKTVFINSHLLQEIELVCEKVGILHQGQLRREATVDDLTTASGEEVRFVLSGDEAAIGDFAKRLPAARLQKTQPGQWELHTHCQNQTELDDQLDALRARGISVRSMTPLQLTLEEAFLGVVRAPDAGTKTHQNVAMATVIDK